MFCKKIKTDDPTEVQVLEALRTNNAAIIDTLFPLVEKKIHEDEDRRKGIEQKAFSVIQFSAVLIGFLLTSLIFAVKDLGKYSDVFFNKYSAISGIGIFFSYLILLGCAWNALRVRRAFRTTAYKDLFAIGEHDQDNSAIVYKRYLTAHFWFVYSENFKVTEAKASSLRHGFLAFFVIIFLLCCLTGSIGFNLYKMPKGGVVAEENNKNSGTTNSPPADNRPPATKQPSTGTDMQKSENPPATRTPSKGQGMSEDKGRRKQ